MQNFMKLDDRSILTASYMYIDHPDFLADIMLRQAGVRMKFTGDFRKKDETYCIVVCKVRKKDTVKFEEVMGKLPNKMLLTGHTDYPEVCEKYMAMLKKEPEE